MTNIKALLRERLFVPRDLVTKSMLDAWTYEVPDPDSEDRNDKLEVRLWKDQGSVFSFCRGDLGKIAKHFPDFVIADKRAAPPMFHPITFTGKLFDPSTDPLGRNQQEVVDIWLSKGYGQIRANPRFGKTVVTTSIISNLGLKTILFSHQWDLLSQFEKTIRSYTDINQLEQVHGKKLLSRLDEWDWDRLDELDIVLTTWQSWWHPNNRIHLKKYRDSFGLVCVDESHLQSADCYSRVVNSLNSKYRCGNSATPQRLSELHVITENIIGPVVAKGISRQMQCKVFYVHTDSPVMKFKAWTDLVTKLTKNKQRNQLIADTAFEDASKGRFILITTERVDHAQKLANLIAAKGISVVAVTGQTTERDEIWDKARKGEVQVVVAMRKITRLGIDVPLWNTFYNILPTSDPNNYYQELSRIRTYYEGKPVPIIRDFIDDPDDDARGAIYGTMKKREKVYREQNFSIESSGFQKSKPSSNKLTWGRKPIM